jgi:GT2 family glycosyltransferase
VTVVVCTVDRVRALRDTLGALRRQTHTAFEVVVVNGPSRDGTAAHLASLGDTVRTLENGERHLSRSRNLGIAAAAGDVVAFIDDDAVPEPRWLEELVAPFAGDERLGATGGLVLDHTGVRAQWRHLVCARTGDQDFDRLPPLDRFTGPGADPFLYVPGGNCAMRRAALAEVGGFDEEVEYNFDETEVCLQLHDAGWGVRSLDGARVHHRALPSHLRTDAAFLDPFFEVKNRVYFGLRHGTATRRQADVLAALTRHVGALRGAARDAVKRGRMTEEQLVRYLGRADAGFHAGLQRGLHGHRRSVVLPPADPAAFRPYDVLSPRPRRRLVLVEARDDAAAAAGHEVHAVEPVAAGEPFTVAYEDGTWVWRAPVNPRWLPAVDDPDERARVERQAAIDGALATIDGGRPDRFPVDWEAEARACLAEADDDAFVTCAYRRLLGRDPEPLGRRMTLVDLQAGTERADVLRRFADSVEGRGRGIDAGAMTRLPPVSRRQAEAAVRAAWLRDDDAFARELTAALLGRPEPLPAGDRTAAVRALARRPEVRERVAGAEHLPPPDARSADQLGAELDAALALRDDDAFVAAAYRLLLGREPDPDGAAAYRGTPRDTVIRTLAGSAEGAARGVVPDVVEAHLATSRAFKLDAARRRVRALAGRTLSRAPWARRPP